MRRFTLLLATAAALVTSTESNVHAWTPTNPDAISVVQIGGPDADTGSEVAVDSQGNMYLAGIFSGTTDFDPGPNATSLTAAVSNSVFVVKLDNRGTFLWARAFGQASGEKPVALAVNQSQEVFVASSFSAASDFDPGSGVNTLTPAAPGDDAFVVKLKANGDLDWVTTFGGAGTVLNRALAIDGSSNVYVVGRFIGSADLQPGGGSPATSAGDDAYLVKLSSTGLFVFAKTFGGAFSDIATGVAVDSVGNIFVTGSYSSTANFDPNGGSTTLTVAGQNDAFLLKLTQLGSLEWVKSFGGSNSESTYSVAVDQSDNPVISGVFRDSGDFDPSGATSILTSTGDYDIAVAKLTGTGAFLWAVSVGGTNWDEVWDLAVDETGSVYATGTFGLAADFDPSPATATLTLSSYGVFVLKLSSSGAYEWARALGGASFDAGHGIAVDAQGNSFTTGYFSGSSDFDPGSGSATLTGNASSQDAFLIRLDSTGNATIDVTPPTATWTSPSSPSTSRALTFTATFSEAVYGIAADDFTNTGTATGCVFAPSAASTTSSITVSVTCTSDGTVVPQLAANSVRDGSFNTGPLAALSASSVTIETPTQPSVEPSPTTTAAAPTTTAAPSTPTTAAPTTTTAAPAVRAASVKRPALPSAGQSPTPAIIVGSMLVVAGGLVARRRSAKNP